TCWQFPGVARRANNFTGAMLVLYVLARHPSQGYNYSAALLEEADEWHDIITLPMNEGRPNTTKLEYSSIDWGVEVQIGMSRKTFLWFELALRLFPRVNYITKADDDIFLRVPQFLSDLLRLPQQRIYWGLSILAFLRRGNVTVRFRFAGGMCYTLSRDTAEWLVSYEPLKRLVHLPYTKEREKDFLSLGMNGEDYMVGRILRVESPYTPLVFVAEMPCRFHNLYNESLQFSVNPKSVVIHHLEENDYAMLMDRFGNGTTYSPRMRFWKKHKYMKFRC
ncbi:UDP-Gal or UDP-GlcNAc-dependent glycosyltransferase, partial [Trypanosoma theileri]